MKFHLILIVSEVYRFFVVELFENSLYGVKYDSYISKNPAFFTGK